MKLPTPDPATHLIALGRVDSAIDHVEQARAELDAACRALCSITGGALEWRRTSKLSDAARDLRRRLELLHEKPVDLDGCAKAAAAGVRR